MPDDTDPPATHWIPQAIREFKLLIQTPVIATLAGALCGGGFAGCQSMKNAERIDGARTEVVGKVDDAKMAADVVKQKAVTTEAKLDSLAEKVDKTPAATAAAVKGK